jgi:hypothetical protein
MYRVWTVAVAALLIYCPINAFARGGGGGHSSSSSRSTNSSSHYTQSYSRTDGTLVPGYRATNPNGTKLDNYSTKGNINPWTGRPGTKSPDGEAKGYAARAPGAPPVETASVATPPTPAAGPPPVRTSYTAAPSQSGSPSCPSGSNPRWSNPDMGGTPMLICNPYYGQGAISAF